MYLCSVLSKCTSSWRNNRQHPNALFNYNILMQPSLCTIYLHQDKQMIWKSFLSLGQVKLCSIGLMWLEQPHRLHSAINILKDILKINKNMDKSTFTLLNAFELCILKLKHLHSCCCHVFCLFVWVFFEQEATLNKWKAGVVIYQLMLAS